MLNSLLRFSLVRNLLFAIVCAMACQSLLAKGKYDFAFGLLLPQADGFWVVSTETYSIEKIVHASYLHGFTVNRRKGGRFMVSYSIRFPEPLDTGGVEPKTGAFSEGGRVYTSDGKFVWDRCFEAFAFSETDPLGDYELKVFIDGKLYREIKYSVEKPLSDIEFDEDLGF